MLKIISVSHSYSDAQLGALSRCSSVSRMLAHHVLYMCFTLSTQPGIIGNTCSSIWQEDQEFKSIFDYVVSSGLAWAIGDASQGWEAVWWWLRTDLSPKGLLEQLKFEELVCKACSSLSGYVKWLSRPRCGLELELTLLGPLWLAYWAAALAPRTYYGDGHSGNTYTPEGCYFETSLDQSLVDSAQWRTLTEHVQVLSSIFSTSNIGQLKRMNLGVEIKFR